MSTSHPVNIICTIDVKYIKHCAAMLASVFSNTSRLVHVFLIHNGLADDKFFKLQQFVKEQGHLISLMEIHEDLLKGAPVSDHISIATYFRILIPEIMPHGIEKALFLDSDIIIRRDIGELFEKEISTYSHAAASDNGSASELIRSNLGMEDRSLDYFNAGVMLINLKYWRDNNIAKKAISFIQDHSSKIVYWDQDTLNFVLKGQWLKMSSRWNAIECFYQYSDEKLIELGYPSGEIEGIKSDPYIVHYTGNGKPWVFGCSHPFREDYFAWLKKTPFHIGKLENSPTIVEKAKEIIRPILRRAKS